MEDHSIIQATGDILTAANLRDTTSELRRLVLKNAHRLPKARQLADKLGSIESIIVEDLAKPVDDGQEALPLDKPEPVEAELGYENGQARRRKAS